MTYSAGSNRRARRFQKSTSDTVYERSRSAMSSNVIR